MSNFNVMKQMLEKFLSEINSKYSVNFTTSKFPEGVWKSFCRNYKGPEAFFVISNIIEPSIDGSEAKHFIGFYETEEEANLSFKPVNEEDLKAKLAIYISPDQYVEDEDRSSRQDPNVKYIDIQFILSKKKFNDLLCQYSGVRFLVLSKRFASSTLLDIVTGEVSQYRSLRNDLPDYVLSYLKSIGKVEDRELSLPPKPESELITHVHSYLRLLSNKDDCNYDINLGQYMNYPPSMNVALTDEQEMHLKGNLSFKYKDLFIDPMY